MKSKKKSLDEEEGVGVCCGLCYCTRRQRCVFWTTILLPILFLLALILTLLVRAALVEEVLHLKQLSDEPPSFINATEETKRLWATNLGNAIKIETVSLSSDDISYEELKQLHEYLYETFPLVFNSPHVEKTIVNDYSMLLRVQGAQPTANPYMLTAHFDVVPAGNLDLWDHPPFLGEIVEQEGKEYIYGRGAIDDKHSLIGILQALEEVIAEQGQPNRTLYLAFGHDEEVSGFHGARHMAKVIGEELESRNETLAFIIDEGMTVVKDIMPGQDDPIIIIGVVEKGSIYLDLEVQGVQGHSSVPPRETAVGILATALSNLESNPHPARFGDGPEYDTLRYLAPSSSFLYKIVFSNLWLFSPIVSSIFSNDPPLDATQRTTTAITIVNAGIKDNVIPSVAKAVVNHRIYPLSNDEETLEHDRSVIDDDRVRVTVREYTPAPKVSSYSDDSMPFQIIANSAKQVFPTAHVAPTTMFANTDSLHYTNLTNNIYRFSPTFMLPDDMARFHGINERISVENFHQVVQFYYRVMMNADTDVADPYAVDDDLLADVEGSAFEDIAQVYADEGFLFEVNKNCSQTDPC